MFAIPTHIKAWTYSEYGNSTADIVSLPRIAAEDWLKPNLVSKWKRIVDEWVKLKTPGQADTDVMADEDSPDHLLHFLGKLRFCLAIWLSNILFHLTS
ncbi:hypothetical protein RIF29_19725 [Crotalaria pallida]|uniref:Uncharacterized protein n=1 Tax=Crotalaria pallida TaxID=3830 RepID=A0AAN9F2Z9_CROPI